MKARYSSIDKMMPTASVLKENYISVQKTEGNVKLSNDVLINMYPQINPNFISEAKLFGLDMSSPPVFGPPLWLTMHNASIHYPVHPSPLVIERMKNFILAIPVLIPCETCKEHANAYIEENFSKLDEVCSGRMKLFNFFVDFHNYVNIRLNKPVMSYEDAFKLYSDF